MIRNYCKLLFTTTCMAALALVFIGCATSSPVAEQKFEQSAQLYTAYNLWYENPKSLWCINYKTGNIIPPGTEVRNLALTKAAAGRKSGADKIALSFITVHDGQRYWVNITNKFHPGKTLIDYKDMMFTERNFDQLTEGFSSEEIDAINKGVLVLGMSKTAVIVAYGYPPEHKTSSLENNIWSYWMNRFRSKAIHFDENGKTSKPKKLKNEL